MRILRLAFCIVAFLFGFSSQRAKSVGSSLSSVELFAFQNGLPAGFELTLLLGKEAKLVACSTSPGVPCRFDLPPGAYELSLKQGEPTQARLRKEGSASMSPLKRLNFRKGDEARVFVQLPAELGPSWEPHTDWFIENSLVESVEVGKEIGQGSDSDSAPIAHHIRGRVVSFDGGAPISQAQVYVKGTEKRVVTDEKGLFSIRMVAESAEATLAVVHPEYSSLTLQVDARELAVIKLSPLAIALEELVVTAPHIRGSDASFAELRKESLVVSDVIGSEQMSRNGDSNAAAALQRVTGLTLLGGKYIYVRGLGERYSSTTLNGSALPSPEPTRRVIPLDLFPSGVLEGVVVQKSFTPDMPGEFGGGTLRLRTRKPPAEGRVKFSLSTEFEDSPSVRHSHHGGQTDWIGLDDGSRALPEAIRKSDRGPIEEGKGYSASEIESFGESFSRRYRVTREEQPNALLERPFSASIELGHSLSWKNWTLGGVLSGLYSYSIDDSERTLKRYTASNGQLDSLDKNLKYEQSKRTYSLGGLAQTSLSYAKHHRLDLVSLLTRKSTDTTQIKSGTTGGGDDTIRTSKLEWNERELSFQQLSGQHSFLKRFDLGWRYSQADARNYVPDTRLYRYELRGEDYLISNRSDGNSRSFASLLDQTEDWGLDAGATLMDDEWWVWRLQLGMSSFYKRRDYKMRRFFFRFPDFLDVESRKKPLEDLLTPEDIGPGSFTLVETTRNTDTYVARHIIDATYASNEFSVGEAFSLVGGLRMEHSRQEVLTFALHDAGQRPESAELEADVLLPAASLTYRFLDGFQFRLGYSETVSRPDFRELSTASYYDDRLDMEVQGFSGLKTSRLENYDSRLEWYSPLGDRVSVGVFRKDIRRPIERILLNVAGNDTKLSYRNSEKARNEGLELEFGVGLGRLWNSLDRVSLSGNYSLIESSIKLDLKDIANEVSLTSTERALQGVSPYAFNLSLIQDYRDFWGMQINLIYNEIGPRITELGTNGMPDVFEDARRNLDLIVSQEIGKNWSAKLQVKNILTQGTTTRQAGKVIYQEPGYTAFKIGVTANF